MSTAPTKQLPKIQPRPQQRPLSASTPDAEQAVTDVPEVASVVDYRSGNPIVIDLGFSGLVPVDSKAYCSAHAQIEMTEQARTAIKRLSLTLASSGERLSNGKIVGTSVANAVVWLCERLAEASKQ